MSSTSTTPTNQEIISTLLDVKKYEPLKTGYSTPANYVKTLWFVKSEGLVESTQIGYAISAKGQKFLDSNSDYDSWLQKEIINHPSLSARDQEKAEALKGMRKYGIRFLFWSIIVYLVCHYWLKIF